jgi:hypothetical protein
MQEYYMSKRINSIIKICAALGDDGKGDFKRLNNMEFLDEESNKNMRESLNYEEDTDRWIRLVVNDLCKIIGLNSPMFLGSSRRAVASGSGAYAFSASSKKGEPAVIKIVLEGELQPYKEMIQKYNSIDEKHRFILPKVYLAKTFDELGYSPPEKLTTSRFAVVVMEELEKMPQEMIDIYFSRTPEGKEIIDGENLRYFINDKESLRSFISEIFNIEIKFRIIDEVSLDKISFKENIDDEEKKYILNMLFNNIKLYFEDIFTRRLSSSNYDYANNIFDLEQDVKYSMKNALDNSFQDFSQKITISSNDIQKNINYSIGEFARAFTKKLISNRTVITAIPMPERKLLSNRFKSITKVKEAIDSLSLYGIYASDLHMENIMIRPSTGDLVISDIGHFMVRDSKTEKTYESFK